MHLTGITVDLGDRKFARLSKTGVFIAILLIAASLTQSVHTCALSGLAANRHELSARTPDPPCNACLLGPAVASATLPLFAVALLEVPMVPVAPPISIVTVRHGFVISVRPPPLASFVAIA